MDIYYNLNCRVTILFFTVYLVLMAESPCRAEEREKASYKRDTTGVYGLFSNF